MLVDSVGVTTYHAVLEAETGVVTILVRPWGDIYVDGELQKRATDVQFTMLLPVGIHEVRAVHPAMGSRVLTVRARADQPQQVLLDLHLPSERGRPPDQGR